MAYAAACCEVAYPECTQRSFVDAGNSQDAAGCNIEAVECPSCQHVFDLEGDPADSASAHEAERGSHRARNPEQEAGSLFQGGAT